MHILALVTALMALLVGAPQGGVLAGTRTGVISGRVRVPNGAPAAGIRVAAMEAPEMGTQDSAVSVMAGLTMTDDTGQYRLEDIPIGKYFVVAGSLDNLSYYPTSITLTSVIPAENVDFFLSDTNDGVIDVTVHHVGSPTPVAGAFVTIRSTTSTVSRSVETKDNGVASFSGIPYGDYLVSTPSIAMASALNGGTGRRDLSVTITINPDRPKWAVSLGLLFPGIIRGIVRNADGTPAPDVLVSSMNTGYRNGRRTLLAESSTRTGDAGEYELRASPGTHFIRVTSVVEDSSAVPDASLAYRDSYYPSSMDSVGAKPVVVGNRGEVSGVDVTMGRTFTVSGQIVNARADSPPPTFALLSRSGRDEVIPSVRYSPQDSGGTFELRGVPAGAWDLFAVAGTNPEQHQSGRILIDVRDQDLAGVTVPYLSVNVRGKITGLGSEIGTVQLVPSDSITGALRDAVPGIEFPNADGDFVFANVPALQYRIAVHGLLPGWYVADIRVGATSIFNNNSILIGATPPPPIEVVVRQGAGSIQGTVENISPNVRLDNARVVLVPDPNRRQNVFLYRTAPIQDNGRFSIYPDPAPGTYTMFAVSNLPAGNAEWNAEFLAKYADAAISIQVLPNSAIQSKLNFTPAR